MARKKLGSEPPKRATKAAAPAKVTRPAQPKAPALEPAIIALRAYDKWRARGCPIGDDLRDWLEAEQELKREAAQA